MRCWLSTANNPPSAEIVVALETQTLQVAGAFVFLHYLSRTHLHPHKLADISVKRDRM